MGFDGIDHDLYVPGNSEVLCSSFLGKSPVPVLDCGGVNFRSISGTESLLFFVALRRKITSSKQKPFEMHLKNIVNG